MKNKTDEHHEHEKHEHDDNDETHEDAKNEEKAEHGTQWWTCGNRNMDT